MLLPHGKAFTVLGVLMMGAVAGAAEPVPQLRLSENKRFFQTPDGQPFFWLGDTAWELFHRTTREEAEQYLKHRAAHGFNVIQAVALAEERGLTEPNAYGFTPLIDNDPMKPNVKDGPDNDYWDHVDFVVNKANSLGMLVGFLPTWGDKWNKKWGVGPEIFTLENAEKYGQWLGKRYKNAGIVWILGGDRPVETDQHREIIRRMAAGLRQGDGGQHLISFHPNGGAGSSQFFPQADWLDFHMRQNGHAPEFTGRYDQTRKDYDRAPVKPVLDAEPIYEDHPVSFDANKLGHSIASDVRRPLYWDLFSGACGHTYGHHSIWQFASAKFKPVNNPLLSWTEALEQPGALQMKHGKQLLLSRPYFTRIPDDSVIVVDRVPTQIPGAGRFRMVATRDESGTYAMVYQPVGRKFLVKMATIKGAEVNCWWYNPRNGEANMIGTFPNTGERTFTPPDLGEMLDWVLVLDDASKKYLAPGERKLK